MLWDAAQTDPGKAIVLVRCIGKKLRLVRREKIVSSSSSILTAKRVRVIIVSHPTLMNDPKAEAKTPTMPSWSEAKIISTNPPKDPNAAS